MTANPHAARPLLVDGTNVYASRPDGWWGNPAGISGAGAEHGAPTADAPNCATPASTVVSNTGCARSPASPTRSPSSTGACGVTTPGHSSATRQTGNQRPATSGAAPSRRTRTAWSATRAISRPRGSSRRHSANSVTQIPSTPCSRSPSTNSAARSSTYCAAAPAHNRWRRSADQSAAGPPGPAGSTRSTATGSASRRAAATGSRSAPS